MLIFEKLNDHFRGKLNGKLNLNFYIMSKEKKFLIMVTANEIAGFSKKSVTSAKRFIKNHEFEITGVTFGPKNNNNNE